MIVRDDVDSCRKGMKAYVGRRVRLKSSGGRKRIIIQEGILENCYPNVFTVRCHSKNSYPEMVSFSYVDILTRVVEIAIETNESDRGAENDNTADTNEEINGSQSDENTISEETETATEMMIEDDLKAG